MTFYDVARESVSPSSSYIIIWFSMRWREEGVVVVSLKKWGIKRLTMIKRIHYDDAYLNRHIIYTTIIIS